MRSPGFAALYAAIDETNRTNEKVDAMVAYFESAPGADSAWAVHFLVGVPMAAAGLAGLVGIAALHRRWTARLLPRNSFLPTSGPVDLGHQGEVVGGLLTAHSWDPPK